MNKRKKVAWAKHRKQAQKVRERARAAKAPPTKAAAKPAAS